MSLLGRKPAGARLERVLASPRFRDGRFHNLEPTAPGLKPGTVVPTMREFLRGGVARRPPAPLPAVDPRESWLRPSETGLRTTWLGHSTLLLELDGRRVLTDPVFGERASPMPFAGPRRFQPTPVPLDALPPLDAVLISHDHYDHLCRDTVRALARRPVPFVTSLGVGAHLEAFGVEASRIVELDWWESAEVGGVRCTATPARHFSGRTATDRNRTAWSSFVLEAGRQRVFFSGDTGLSRHFAEIAARFGRFDLVMLEVGAFHPSWGDIHLGPDGALEALRRLGGGPFLPIHWGTFDLGLHAWDDPAERLFSLAPSAAPLLTPRLGEALEPARAEAPSPWWRNLRQPARPASELSLAELPPG